MSKQSVRILTMITGVLTALVVVFSQIFCFQPSTYAKKEVKTNQEKNQHQESDKDDSSYISLPSISQSSSTHIEVEHESTFLQEILFEEKEEHAEKVEIPFSIGKFFHTLFRVIISPNAP